MLDLDRLMETCRSETGKSYMKEAVGSYYAGAYRASIVVCWIAVTLDFIEKLTELESLGDAEATNVLNDVRIFLGKVDKQNIERSLEFERTFLDLAEKKFELISPVERMELERLREDRNRCAHPTMLGDDLPYSPTAELARYHIRTAVEAMLSQPPVQGKAALAKLHADVKSELFPNSVDGAEKLFRAGPLNRARPVLVRNFQVSTCKLFVGEDVESDLRKRAIVAIQAVHRIHPRESETYLNQSLPSIVEAVSDERLNLVIGLLSGFPESVSYVGTQNVDRARRYLSHYSGKKQSSVISAALRVPALRDAAKARLEDISNSSLSRLLESSSEPILLSDAVRRYLTASGFDDANQMAQILIIPNLGKFDAELVARIVEGIIENTQLRDSFESPKVLLGILQLPIEISGDQCRWEEYNARLREKNFRYQDSGLNEKLTERFEGFSIVEAEHQPEE